MPFSMRNKVVFITGGAGGLGKAAARMLVEGGAQVRIADHDREGCEAAARQLGCDACHLDVTGEQAWKQAIAKVSDDHGRLDALVNCAGVEGSMGGDDPETTSLADWRRVHAINLDGTFLGCRTALPVIAASGGGAIVNMSSVGSMRATPFATAYGSSKAAVRQLTMSIAVYCGEKRNKVRCNSIHPGPVRTEMLARTIRGIAEAEGHSVEAFSAQYASMIPQGEFQEPDDVASMILYLLSDEARHVTGAEFVVDGGLAVRL